MGNWSCFGIPGRPLASLIMELDKQDINFILNKHESGAGLDNNL